MTGELKAGMARLREIAPRLDSQTDEVSKLVATVEKFLTAEARIGISAAIEFEDEEGYSSAENRPTRIDRYLAFGRANGSFCIHILEETGILDNDGDWDHLFEKDVILWPSCSREMKLKAFTKLPALLQAIIKEAERLSDVVDDVAPKVKEMMGAQ